MNPVRIQLSRRKGWRMPANTVKVDRTTPWGNPFAPGSFGDRRYCVLNFVRLMGGLICLCGNYDQQKALLDRMKGQMGSRFPSLRGKNLACWCPPGAPCHADVLLILVNHSRKKASQLIDEYCRERLQEGA